MKRRKLSVGLVLAMVASVLLPVSFAGAQGQVRCGGEVATMVGTNGNDTLIGTPGRDVIVGLKGNDYIDGFGGNDILCGNGGADLIIGSDGADVIYGGNGNDEIYAGGQESLVLPFVRDDTGSNRIFAGAGRDTVLGSNKRDVIEGGPGADRLLGFGGKDKILGGKGADHITGNGGKDNLQGGAGSDVVLGEQPDSKVRGGSGTDFCPDLPNTGSWQGCEELFAVNGNNSTLPSFSVPTELAGGAAEWYVFLGANNGEINFVGITDDLRIPIEDPQFDTTFWITSVAVRGGQAQAIGQAILELNPSFRNDFNFVDPGSAFYFRAVDWGEEYLAINGV